MGYLIKKMYVLALKQIEKENQKNQLYRKKVRVIQKLLDIKNIQDDILFSEHPGLSFEYNQIYYAPIKYNEKELKKGQNKIINFI